MENKQFVKVPITDLKALGLEMKDLVVYAYLKKHYNHTTKEAFPSYSTLVKESGISKPTLISCVNRLEAAGYITVIKDKKVNHYKFSDINKFEIYSFDFLDNPNLTTADKAYIICMQPHMFKSETGIGTVAYSDSELAELLNIDVRTLRNYERHLKAGSNPILTMTPSLKKDPISGLAIQERTFDFSAFSNLIAIKFLQVDQRMDENDLKIQKQNEEIEKLKKELLELKKQINTEEIKPIEL